MKIPVLVTPLLICLIYSACGSRKEQLYVSPHPGTFFGPPAADTVKRDTFVFLLKNNSNKPAYDGPFNVVFKMETAKINGKDYIFYQTREFTLTNESEFIHFDNAIGFKFFRVSNIEMGQHKNYFKYQIYIYENGYWKECLENADMREIGISKKRSSNLSQEGTKVSSSSEKLNYAFSYSFLMP